jgi:hypothetical protein
VCVPKNRPTRHSTHRARRAETLGCILIAIFIFLFTWARFAKSIHWSAR